MLYSKLQKTLKLSSITLIGLILCNCGPSKINETASTQLRFLDEYVIPEKTTYQGTKVGGLSGIDYRDNNFYVVCDQPSNPRVYQLSIPITDEKIDSIIFTDLIELQKKHEFITGNVFDSESVLFDPLKEEFTISSEGSINSGKNPSIIRMDSEGNYLMHYQIPTYFEADNKSGPQHNGMFEGLSRSYDEQGIWVATELPLSADGPKPKLYRTKSPVRITYYDQQSKQAEKEFAYLLEPIKKIPFLPFSINGVTDLLELKKDKFLVIERAFSAGRGKRANRILIYEVDASKATNTLLEKELKGKIGEEIKPAVKKLVFDLESIRKQLTNKHIDNIEGISFGPRLPNGNKSLFLISDNNFNSFGKQLNQVLLFEIIQ